MSWATRNVGSLRHGLALLHVIMTMLVTLGLFTVEIPEKNGQLLNLLVGAMISNASLVVGYYFGNQTRRMADGA
ncbi:hypothetical protein KEM14_gp55 [Xanthomonas virus phiXaf18]|uniref:Membrane protein n=2 Tax=Beograduvirus TaxID=2946820 RepID=A0A3G1GLK2_9CAUD|nr:hypothetical protein KEM13_gp43 [Xanthomonas phage KPhi1]YP_010052679.1 hypothetical protein KEM14_gp55 [Xanthomonas virus phiXaf18]APQ41922.1 putative membrane protein [Xanthomonas phage KPhi1]QFR59553.1 hypothetical protein phiXaf18_55 [Xanthomonas virus phiXaf18]UUW40445.1 hypothetical protein [Xanthomonas phage BsXeu269p/3]